MEEADSEEQKHERAAESYHLHRTSCPRNCGSFRQLRVLNGNAPLFNRYVVLLEGSRAGKAAATGLEATVEGLA